MIIQRGIIPFCPLRNSNQSRKTQTGLHHLTVILVNTKTVSLHLHPFWLQNHSQVFASYLEKSQFTMEMMKNKFDTQISNVTVRIMSATIYQSQRSGLPSIREAVKGGSSLIWKIRLELEVNSRNQKCKTRSSSLENLATNFPCWCVSVITQ